MSSAPQLDAALQAMYEPVRRAAREAAVQVEALSIILATPDTEETQP